MKFQISKSVLTKSLSYNQSIVEKRTTLPILSHILLEAKENSLTITSTNMDMSFIQKIDCVVEEEGKICIPSQLFFDIARKLGEGIISFQLDPKTLFLHIHAKRSQFKLPGMKGEEFPSITLTPLTHEFFIQGNELSYLIDQSRFAICDEETRFVLNWVYFHVVE
jgi:DNA polymerase-3 subunit beta